MSRLRAAGSGDADVGEVSVTIKTEAPNGRSATGLDEASESMYKMDDRSLTRKQATRETFEHKKEIRKCARKSVIAQQLVKLTPCPEEEEDGVDIILNSLGVPMRIEKCAEETCLPPIPAPRACYVARRLRRD